MEQVFKFNHVKNFTPPFHKTILHTSLSASSQILWVIFVCLASYLHLNRIQDPIFLALVAIIFLVVFKTYIISSSPAIYLVDYSCLKPPNYWRVPFSSFIEHSRIVHSLDQESVNFMSKILVSSGQGQGTYIPPPLHYIPPRSTQEDAIKEAQEVLFPAFEDLLSKTKLSPQEIDIIIVNCSGFCPSPSLSAIIVNQYSMREDVKSFNISGMGCSASAMAVDMAHNLLKSSSSLWYELAYMEAKERVKQGERVLQLGMGTGPKCTSLVWECNRPIVNEAHKGPWAECIDRYPS
ncbi:hypothetical protein E3N88_44277 [Mikania micrantha]|uniref:FAE domain-containing protein n=1 Tax=Mikania micrantha TaxID=192012 RepID=A0A5N6LCG8_9ASTR|nr:hypothetical protein E3N88_44277 [Mikania micrantha]